jgi:hypothetical protein
MLFKKCRPMLRCQGLSEAKGDTQVRGRLPMSTKPGRPGGRERSVFENGSSILSQRGVVYEPRRIDAVFHERLEDIRVQRASPFGRNHAVNGKPRKLVAEPDGVTLHDQQTTSAGFVNCRLPYAQDRFEEPSFRSSGRNRHDLGKFAGGPRTAPQAREYSVTHGFRDKLAGARKHLAHEEGIATGNLMKELGIPSAVPCQYLDCCSGKGRQPHSNDVMSGELSERKPHGMTCRKFVVAIGGDKDRVRSLNAPPDES